MENSFIESPSAAGCPPRLVSHRNRCSSEEVSRHILATAADDEEDDDEEDESVGPGDNDLEEWRQVVDDMTECKDQTEFTTSEIDEN